MTKLKKYAGLAAVLVLLGGGLIWYSKNNAQDIIHYKDPGLTAEEKKVYQDKVQQIQEQIDQLPDSASPEDEYKLYMQLAVQNLPLGEYERARRAFTKATQLLPDNPTPYGELSVVERFMQDFERSEVHLKKAIELNPTNAQYWSLMIELQEPLQASAGETQKVFDEALQKTGQHADILILYAKYLENKNDLAGAVEQWKKALEKNPADAALYEAEIKRIQAKLQ